MKNIDENKFEKVRCVGSVWPVLMLCCEVEVEVEAKPKQRAIVYSVNFFCVAVVWLA